MTIQNLKKILVSTADILVSTADIAKVHMHHVPSFLLFFTFCFTLLFLFWLHEEV